MSPAEFKEWRARLGFTQEEAANELGVSRRTVESYESAPRPDKPPIQIPQTIALACEAVTFRVAAEKSQPTLLSNELRGYAQHLVYLLSLPTSSWQSGKTRSFSTLHAMLKAQGEIPEGELSAIEMLFPYTTINEIRSMMYRMPPSQNPTKAE